MAKLPATTIVRKPPPAIDHGRPNARAVTPLSNAPNSFDAPMNTPSTADTRPSWSSGVTNGTIEPRMYIEIMSAADSTTSEMNASV